MAASTISGQFFLHVRSPMSDRELEVLERAVGVLSGLARDGQPDEVENLRVAMQTLKLEHEFAKRIQGQSKSKTNWKQVIAWASVIVTILATAFLRIVGVDVLGLLP
jgi:hypothetical protein